MSIEKIEQEIYSLIENREREKEEVKELLQQKNDEKSELIHQRTKAEQNNDFKTFNKLKKEIEDNEKEQEFLKNRLKGLGNPIYTGEEYFSKIEEIEKSIEEEIEELYTKAVPLVDELEKLLLRERKSTDKANNLIELMKEELINNAIVINGQGTTHNIRKPFKAFQYAFSSVNDVLYRRK